MTNGEKSLELGRRVTELFKPCPEALGFVLAYNEFCHMVDDIVDREPFVDSEFILKAFAKSAQIYSSNFFADNRSWLYPLVLQITNAYADSTFLENCKGRGARQVGDVLRSAGNEMLLTVVARLFGYEAVRSISLLVREVSWYDHHDESGSPV